MAYTQMSLADYLAARKSKLPEIRKVIDMSNHANILTEALASMFEREGLPEDLGAKQRIEEWLLVKGAIAYVRVGKGENTSWPTTAKYPKPEYTVAKCDFGGDPYPEGIGSIAIVYCDNGYVEHFEDWHNNENIVVAFNNKTYTPDLNIPYTAAYLTEYDTSLLYQIYYSRLNPIPIAHDQKTLNAVQVALDNMEVGRIKTILSDNLVGKLTGDGTETGVDLLQLTDPKASDHIQYLDHGADDVKRWFWNTYGMNVSAASKMAQQTVEEVSSGDKQGMIIPLERYKQRLEEVKLLKDRFGWDVTVRFGEPWEAMFVQTEEKEEIEGYDEVEDNGSDPGEHDEPIHADGDSDSSGPDDSNDNAGE